MCSLYKQWRVNPTYQRTKQQVVFVHAEDTAVSLSIPQIFAFDCGKFCTCNQSPAIQDIYEKCYRSYMYWMLSVLINQYIVIKIDQ